MFKPFKFSVFSFLFLGFLFSPQFSYAATFTDVDEDDYFFTTIEYLAERDIFQGYPDGTFGKNVQLNRSELMTLAIRLLNIEPDPNVYKNCFLDVAEEWFAPAICYAKEQGWIQGYENETFKPGALANQAETLKIILNPLFNAQIEAQTQEEIKTMTEEITGLNSEDWFAPYVTFAKTKRIRNNVSFRVITTPYRSNVAETIFRALLVKENNLELYHDYWRDIILREQGFGHLLVGYKGCYYLNPLTFDFYSNYLSSKYDLNDPQAHDYVKNKDSETFPLINMGYFCVLEGGDFLFSNMVAFDKNSASQNLLRFNSEGELTQGQSSSCEPNPDDVDLFSSFSFDYLERVNELETFELIDCLYAKDKSNIYLRGSEIGEADPNSFVILDYPYSKDVNFAYFLGFPVAALNLNNLDVQDFVFADPETFEVIDGGSFPEEDPYGPSNEDIPWGYAKDSQFVFRDFALISGANSETFTLFDAQKDPRRFYSKDDQHVFYKGRILVGADPVSFEILEGNYAKDLGHVYYFGRLLEGVDVQTFQVVRLPKEFDLKPLSLVGGIAFDKNKFYEFYEGGWVVFHWFDEQTMTPINQYFVEQDGLVYFNNLGTGLTPIQSTTKVLDESDFEGFTPIENTPIFDGAWAKTYDKVFLMSTHLIEVTDAPTFEIIDEVYSKDSQNVFHNEWAQNTSGGSGEFLDIPGADPATFQRMSAPGSSYHLAKDANHIYYKRDVLETGDIDIKTAIFVEENREIQDGNGYSCSLEDLLVGDMNQCGYG